MKQSHRRHAAPEASDASSETEGQYDEPPRPMPTRSLSSSAGGRSYVRFNIGRPERFSLVQSPFSAPQDLGSALTAEEMSETGIPLQALSSPGHSRLGDGGASDNGGNPLGNSRAEQQPFYHQVEEARQLVRSHTFHRHDRSQGITAQADGDVAGTSNRQAGLSSSADRDSGLYDGVYAVPAPKDYRGGVLSQLLKLYKSQRHASSSQSGFEGHQSAAPTGTNTPGSTSGATTPGRGKWYERRRSSQDTLANLMEASARLANLESLASGNGGSSDSRNAERGPRKSSRRHRAASLSLFSSRWQKEEERIVVHIAETIARQGFILKLCRALMLHGAPTHRLEEYLTSAARILAIDGQFLYLPECMIISFYDQSTHTTEVRIVRTVQGIDLGKLKDIHQIYKEVLHDVRGVEEAMEVLDAVCEEKEKFSIWLRVLVYGLTSATCGPFSFQARLIDLPIIFCLGCLVGFLQLVVMRLSNLYSSVFEVTATILISFLARAFGSINNGNLFCFSALTQSGIVMLLPGYSILCSALELQSRAIIPGSVRLVYAVLNSLLLGFGITIGAALWGLIDGNATSDIQCKAPLNAYYGFIFVPVYVICISILLQAKWRQMPSMTFIAFGGYLVSFFSSLRFSTSPQIANTLSALCVGVLANIYSRVRHGVAAAALIPAIFVQVPDGLASTGGLLSGLNAANALTNNTHKDPGSEASLLSVNQLSTVMFDVAASMIQIAIGIAVGLFISAIVVYPFGKRRTGLFSF